VCKRITYLNTRKREDEGEENLLSMEGAVKKGKVREDPLLLLNAVNRETSPRSKYRPIAHSKGAPTVGSPVVAEKKREKKAAEVPSLSGREKIMALRDHVERGRSSDLEQRGKERGNHSYYVRNKKGSLPQAEETLR